MHGTNRERRPGPKYRVQRAGNGTNGATIFPDGSERGAQGMKRLRRAVNAIGPPVWVAHITRIRASVPSAEMQLLDQKAADLGRQERCTNVFAFGLIIRHVAGNRYDDGMNIVNRLVDEIAVTRKLAGILL